MEVRASQPASISLLDDLRSDRGMKWVPRDGMWLTALTLHTTAQTIDYDLSIDGGGPPRSPLAPSAPWWTIWLAASVAVLGLGTLLVLWRPARPPLQAA